MSRLFVRKVGRPFFKIMTLANVYLHYLRLGWTIVCVRII